MGVVLDTDIPLFGRDGFGAVEGLPEPEPGVFYLVSAMVGSALSADRRSVGDVLLPGTGPDDGAVRQPPVLPDGSPNPRKGQIIAVTRLKLA